MECPDCRTESDGSYCPECGAPLDGAACGACEAPLLAGARYCTQCGTPVRERRQRAPWIVAGLAVVALVVVLVAPRVAGPDGAAGRAAAPTMQFSPMDGSGGAAPPPLTGTPREQADRLFNRIMEAAATGDTAQVSFFMPMAVEAYRRISDLNADGLYHLSLLHAAAGDAASARGTAERVLDGSPDHLLALGAAARAAVQQGDTAAARGYYDRLLDRYDAEMATDRAEYRDHARILPDYRADARELLGR